MTLLTHSYGKSDVRLTRTFRREDGRHDLFEIVASVQLSGDFAEAYTAGDNRCVVATDTLRNTVYVLAKERPFATIDAFAATLSGHFLDTYPWVRHADVRLKQAAWQRVDVDGRPHPHAFTSAGPQRRTSRVSAVRGSPPRRWGGVRGLLVLKTTGSAWADFHRDRFRTLPDSHDRILATKINATWAYGGTSTGADFDEVQRVITDAMLRTFTTQHSEGVQQTLLAMGEAALAAANPGGSAPRVDAIRLVLPNLHRIPFDFHPFGQTFEHDVYVATESPYGRITGVVARDGVDRRDLFR